MTRVDSRLFENNGLATMWRLDLPLGANETDLSQLIDVQLVLSFDAFFDPALETSVRASLPAGGTAAKATSLKVFAPDELFYLRQQGTGQVLLSAADFPRTQTAKDRTFSTLRLTGPASLVGSLVVRLTPAGDRCTCPCAPNTSARLAQAAARAGASASV